MIRGNNINRFLRGCSDHRDQIDCLHCQLFLLISGYYTTCNIKITYQCKIIIVPEEGWFGQPKYSTPKKDPSTLCRLLLLFSSFDNPFGELFYGHNFKKGTLPRINEWLHQDYHGVFSFWWF